MYLYMYMCLPKIEKNAKSKTKDPFFLSHQQFTALHALILTKLMKLYLK